MNNHLSEEQFARCFVGVATNEERQHLVDCAKCRAEVEGFGSTVTSFRHAIRERVDARVESRVTQPASPGMRKVRWALAAVALVVLGMVPFIASKKPEVVTVVADPAETSPDDLMNAINAHLSRTVPAPMEPMMSLLPSEEYRTE